VVDFGAFVDFGLENDGLLHRSKIGPMNLESLLVGQDIGVDILGVSNENKISLGLAGLNFPVEDADAKKRSLSGTNDTKGKMPVSKKRRNKQ
jgi:predicted RNA-binding protein with RPS1 domain